MDDKIEEELYLIELNKNQSHHLRDYMLLMYSL